MYRGNKMEIIIWPSKKFSTNKHPKAQGLDITIKYPEDWEAEEDIYPNKLQHFSKRFNGVDIKCDIFIVNLSSEYKTLSDKEIAKRIFTEDMMRFALDADYEDYKLLEYKHARYDGQPGDICSFVEEDSEIYAYRSQHCFLYDNKLVHINCMVYGGSSDREETENLYKVYAPIFAEIGNSVVINDKSGTFY